MEEHVISFINKPKFMKEAIAYLFEAVEEPPPKTVITAKVLAKLIVRAGEIEEKEMDEFQESVKDIKH